MDARSLFPLFPAILFLHNAEECLRYDEFAAALPGRLPRRLTSKRVVCTAGLLLTLAAFTLSLAAWVRDSPDRTGSFIAAAFAMGLNGASHVYSSIKKRRFTPGVFSAAALVIPYCLLLVLAVRLPWIRTMELFAVGLAATPFAAGSALLLAYGLCSLLVRKA